MANIKSSQKANRQRITRTARNVAHKTAMRTVIKKVRAAIDAKNAKDARRAARRDPRDRHGGVEGRHQAWHRVALDVAPDRRRLRPEGLGFRLAALRRATGRGAIATARRRRATT